MRNLVLFLLLGLTTLSSCVKDVMEESYTFFRPEYKTREEVKAQVKNDNAREIAVPGKIFVKGNYVFLNEVNKGVHIIDFSNPSNPVKKAFVNIPGNVDIAVRGNFLYADCYTDLMSIDISDPLNVKLASYQEGVFPHRIWDAGYMVDTSLIITNWVRVDTTVRSKIHGGWGLKSFAEMGVLSSLAFSSYAAPSSSSGNGIGGSMARFALYNDFLYTVSHHDLKVFSTTQTARPEYLTAISIGQGDIETVFPYQDKLFIGSQTGMFIYGLNNPQDPVRLSQFTHARACDPVIAYGNTAYVTLKGGGFCAGISNQLDVIDITNITTPQLLKTYPMAGPTGLSRDGNVLMICDDMQGLKFLDASDPLGIYPLSSLTGFKPYDVIGLNGLALMVAEDGLYFINYANPAQPVILSKMAIQN